MMKLPFWLVVLAACGDDTSAEDAAPDVSAPDVSSDAPRDTAAEDVPQDIVVMRDAADTSERPDVPAPDTGPDAAAPAMGFFVTAEGSGAMGGNLGGLDGADARCAAAAAAVGAGGRVWRAYLSVEGPPVVNARDRIGSGPWHNARGELVATDVDGLHENGIEPELMFDEAGMVLDDEIPGEGHDILTGSEEDGTLRADRTCQDWTSNARADRGRVGHHDHSIIPMPISPNQNWNSVHDTRCDEASIIRTLGSGRLYCFAAD